MSDQQIDKLLDRLQTAISAEDGDRPQMPFETALTLTKEQEEQMVEYALQRYMELNSELGRDIAASDDWWRNGQTQEVEDAENTGSPERTFMGKRKIFELTYNNEVDWRKTVVGGIFAHSNLVVPLARRITRQMTARANNYFFGTDPWFAAYPVGKADEDVARKAQKYGIYKSRRAKSRATHEMANETAFQLGEAVVKSTHKTKETIYERYQEVMIDGEGRPIMAEDGDYITPDDKWIPTEDGSGAVLERDGVTPHMENANYERVLVKRKMRQYHGPEQKVLHYLDFLCPLNAESIDDADVCMHIYDMELMELADTWAKHGVVDLSAVQSDEVTKRAVEVLRKLSGSGSNGDSSTSRGREELGENQDSKQFMAQETSVEIAEVYLRFDANNDGLMEEIMLVVDVSNRIPIYYDYLANITPDGRRPFRCVRINPVKGRWHGLGSMEMFESTQNIVDLLVNRWNFAQTAEARVDFWNPQATLEGQANPHLKLNHGECYTLAPGKKAEDALQSVYLQENKGDNLQTLMEFFIQLGMNESGVQHANDAYVAGLDSQKLATGIRNIEKTGQEMFSVYLSHLEDGHTEVLESFFDLLYANIDPDEVITYFEEDNPEDFIQISGEEVMDIELNVEILLTRQRAEEIMASLNLATEVIEKFYLTLPPQVQAATAPFYINILRTLNINNAEEVIQPGLVPDPAAGGAGPTMDPNQAAAAVATEPREMVPNI